MSVRKHFMNMLASCQRYRGKEIKKWKEIEECHSEVLYGDDTDVHPEAQKYLMYSDGDFTRVK